LSPVPALHAWRSDLITAIKIATGNAELRRYASEDRPVDRTHALQSATTASVVRIRSGELVLTDGPFAETKEQIGGFLLIEAKDFSEALQIAARWPSARIGSIEVRPIEEELKPDRRY
jgi:hypothetical protein